MDSIRENGIIQPVLVRPLSNGKYEIISGHCRTEAARIVGLKTIPIVVVSVDDYTATKLMTHSNISGRDEILPSEKAKAYRMCLDEEKKLGKNRTDTAETVGAGKDSKRQVQRFVRLSYLSDDFLALIDTGKLTVQIGTELAFLDPERQVSLYASTSLATIGTPSAVNSMYFNSLLHLLNSVLTNGIIPMSQFALAAIHFINVAIDIG